MIQTGPIKIRKQISQKNCVNYRSNSQISLTRDSHFDEVKNRYIIEATITYIKESERFSGSLFD